MREGRPQGNPGSAWGRSLAPALPPAVATGAGNLVGPAGEPGGDASAPAGLVERLTGLAGPFDSGALALAVVVLTIVGTFFRGPNWAWVWPWAP